LESAKIVPYKKYVEPMGDATHECGSARMGTDPAKSVLNSYCQSHDVKNLFVTDGSCFVPLPGRMASPRGSWLWPYARPSIWRMAEEGRDLAKI